MSARHICVNDTDGDGNCAACARNPEAPCRMSPRDAIHRLFESGATSYRLDGYLDAYAHELAEKQRKHFVPRPPGETADYVRGLDDGLDKAADLIDPEVRHD